MRSLSLPLVWGRGGWAFRGNFIGTLYGETTKNGAFADNTRNIVFYAESDSADITMLIVFSEASLPISVRRAA
jgi:hypothetical protein